MSYCCYPKCGAQTAVSVLYASSRFSYIKEPGRIRRRVSNPRENKNTKDSFKVPTAPCACQCYMLCPTKSQKSCLQCALQHDGGVYTCYQHAKYKQKHTREDEVLWSYLLWSVRVCWGAMLKSIVDVVSAPSTPGLAGSRSFGTAGENRMRGVRCGLGAAERCTTSLEFVAQPDCAGDGPVRPSSLASCVPALEESSCCSCCC